MGTATITAVLFLLVGGGARQNSNALLSDQPPPVREVIPQNQAGAHKTESTGTSCLFDFERGEVPNCVLKRTTGDLFIAPQYLKDLEFDSHSLAAVLSPTEGWMYVNRKGKVIIRGVAVMDNGADTFHDGLVRFVRDKKYGFANRSGRIVIPPVYDGAMNFEKGNAEVCKGCHSKCVEIECEYSVFSGGDWFLINTKGAVLKQLHPSNRQIGLSNKWLILTGGQTRTENENAC
jgi:WG containing repeat